MSLELPAAVEPFGDDWTQPGCYILRYSVPDDVEERAERAFENLPRWFDQLQECDTVLYVGEAGNVMHRLEDHANGEKRRNMLSKMGCEPIGVVNVMYHDSKEAAEQAEYNTAKRVARQTDENTLVIVNGAPA